MIDELVRQSSHIEDAKLQGERNMLRLALQGRFGPLSADLQAVLSTADDATIQRFAQHAATETLEMVRARLGLP